MTRSRYGRIRVACCMPFDLRDGVLRRIGDFGASPPRGVVFADGMPCVVWEIRSPAIFDLLVALLMPTPAGAALPVVRQRQTIWLAVSPKRTGNGCSNAGSPRPSG